MSFLSLAKGDPAARALLSSAITARYGLRPLMLSALRLELSAAGRGPFGLPTVQTITARYSSTTHWRWDQTDKVFGITIARRTYSYDGGALYARTGNNTTTLTDPALIMAARNRLWLELSIFLTPLTEEDATVKLLDPTSLSAAPAKNAPEQATLWFGADNALLSAQATCYQPGSAAPVLLRILAVEGLRTMGDFTIPMRLVYFWGESPSIVYTITDAEANPKLPLTEFSIG